MSLKMQFGFSSKYVMTCKLMKDTNKLQDLRKATYIGKKKGQEGWIKTNVYSVYHIDANVSGAFSSLWRILIIILINNKNRKVITHPEDCCFSLAFWTKPMLWTQCNSTTINVSLKLIFSNILNEMSKFSSVTLK